jgi:hypothetical protein
MSAMLGWLNAASVCALAREPRQAIGVAGERVREDLQRDVAIERRIAGAVDLPHAAFADQRRDFVDAETVASRQRHGVRQS